MDMSFHLELADRYHSKSQIARILTEDWTKTHMFCPLCGWMAISKFPNNRKVADFYCPNCSNEFEQKSKNGIFGKKIPGGAYNTLIQRISSNNNPHLFLMNYSLEKMQVENVYFIPNYFFLPEIVERRQPLSESAKRAGWIGCNILLNKIPNQGKIAIVKNGVFLEKNVVLNQVRWAQRIKVADIAARGWLMDVLHYVNLMQSSNFSLSMMYSFENELAIKHPNNNNIRAKIRQQLQILRDREIISFLGNGHYKKNEQMVHIEDQIIK